MLTRRKVLLQFLGVAARPVQRIEPRMAAAIPSVDLSLRRGIELLPREVSGRSTTELIAYVYARFPYYTVNGEIRRLADRPGAEPAVYTSG